MKLTIENLMVGMKAFVFEKKEFENRDESRFEKLW